MIYFFNYSGQFPPDGVKQTLTVCEVGFADNCSRTYEIEVKNCTNYLVYKLKALNLCNSGYCFGNALFDLYLLTYIKYLIKNYDERNISNIFLSKVSCSKTNLGDCSQTFLPLNNVM